MKIELANARVVVQLQMLPSMRRGRLGFACGAPFFLLFRRFRMMWLIATETRARLSGKRPVLKLL